jgi:DNA-binding Xre family transcriptional regulator
MLFLTALLLRSRGSKRQRHNTIHCPHGAQSNCVRMTAKELLAFNLRRLRKRAGMSSEQLATLSGVDPDYIARLEEKRDDVTLRMLERFTNVLGCKPRDFFVGPLEDK